MKRDSNESRGVEKNNSEETNEEVNTNFEINEKDSITQLKRENNLIIDENENRSTETKVTEENKINAVNENLNKTNVIRPKSARPKSGEKEKIVEKHSMVTQEETLLKPLEMSGTCMTVITIWFLFSNYLYCSKASSSTPKKFSEASKCPSFQRKAWCSSS